MPFKDRTDAGRRLATEPQLHEAENAVVISLPRGAVPVAVEVARALNAPIDVMPVEVISTPGKPEYVVGAVAENAIHVIESDALTALGVTEDSIAVRVAEATATIARLAKTYRGPDATAISVAHRPVIVVDDGSASGPALEAVALALSRRNVDSLWLASPVLPDVPIHGYERAIAVEHDSAVADDAAFLGLWYDDKSTPSHDAAGETLIEFVAAQLT